MKLTSKKILVNSFLIAFILSFLTVYIIFPQLNKLSYTSITSWIVINISWWFFLKVLVVLWGQTSLLWGLFYVMAKKIFLKDNNI